MRIGLVCRSLDGFDTSVSVCRLAEKIAEDGDECLIFTGDNRLASHCCSTRFASFFVAAGEHLCSVAVHEEQREGIHIFLIAALDAAVFAAAVTGIISKLAQRETRVDLLHLFDAGDICAVLLCRQFFRIPFVYSVRRLAEIKQRKKDFVTLGILLPKDSLAAGDFILNEPLAALMADYVLDETGDTGLWRSFFSSYAGKYVEMIPYVDTDYWSAHSAKGGTRKERKTRLLQRENGENDKLVVISDNSTSHAPADLREHFLFIPQASVTDEQRKQYQAADFYLVRYANDLQDIFAAAAAGCIPVVPNESTAAHFLSNAKKIQTACYFYEQEDWPFVFRSRINDWKAASEKLTILRQYLVSYAQSSCGFSAAANTYRKIYRGFAPVRLPFIAEDEQTVSAYGIWEGQ